MNTVIADQSRPVMPVLPTPLGLVLGGVCLALADLGFAMAYWAMQQVPLIRIPQSIAAWVLGNHAFAGGGTSALFGTTLYALLMVGVVLAYRLASQRQRLLLRRPLVCGAVYGVLAYLLVFQIVVPHFTAAVVRPMPLDWVLACVVAYIVLIGVPSAKLAQWADRRSRQ
jgi:hypothetical protein